LDAVGRVIDFKVVKELLCEWVENAWDHRFLMWEKDPVKIAVEKILVSHPVSEPSSVDYIADSLCIVPFNPTAENMAEYLLQIIGPQQLEGTGITLKRVIIEETRKCAAIAEV